MKWRGTSNTRVKQALEDLVTRRGEIAHRVTSSHPVRKRDVVNAAELVLKLSVVSSNAVRQFLMTRAQGEPWEITTYRGVS